MTELETDHIIPEYLLEAKHINMLFLNAFTQLMAAQT